MPRKNTASLDDYEADIIEQMRHIFNVTTEKERADHLRLWCSGNHDWALSLTDERNISTVVFIFTAMFETMHPLIYKNDHELRYTITGCLVRIMEIVISGEVIHIPLCTEQEQPTVVHIPRSKKEPSLRLYTDGD